MTAPEDGFDDRAVGSELDQHGVFPKDEGLEDPVSLDVGYELGDVGGGDPDPLVSVYDPDQCSPYGRDLALDVYERFDVEVPAPRKATYLWG